MRQFAERFMSDEHGLARRIQTNRVDLMERFEELKSALRKFDRPALIELESGDFVMKKIESPSIADTSVGSILERGRRPGADLERALSALQRP
jgi:hypothetical protein